MNNGIFSSSLKTFLKAFFGVIGICLGFIFFFAIMGALSSTQTTEIDTHYNVAVLPNSQGIRKVESSTAPVILQLNIAGTIGLEHLNSDAIRAQLVESREGVLKNNRVKALFLNINTPGGTAVDSENIYHAIKEYKKAYNVPVYAYVDGLCASGGMYVASAADKVFASNVSLIGSVGVISPSFFNVTKLMDKMGIEALTLTQGKGKDDMNPLRPWKPDESQSYSDIMHFYYNTFLDIVTEARPKLSKEKLINDYGAQLFPATVAEEYGYIDGSNYSRNDALRELLQAISIEDDYYQVVQLNDNNWVNKLVSSQSLLFSGTVQHKIDLPFTYDPAFYGKFLYLYHPGD